MTARLTSHGSTAGVAGDGRRVFIEDDLARRFPPMSNLLSAERGATGMPGSDDQILFGERFESSHPR